MSMRGLFGSLLVAMTVAGTTVSAGASLKSRAGPGPSPFGLLATWLGQRERDHFQQSSSCMDVAASTVP